MRIAILAVRSVEAQVTVDSVVVSAAIAIGQVSPAAGLLQVCPL